MIILANSDAPANYIDVTHVDVHFGKNVVEVLFCRV